MALPKINETLKFTMKVPSTGQTVNYRPYLVKEEKVLLQAFESKDSKMCLQAMSDTIAACLDHNSGIEVKHLATFDIEYMFTQLRSKSVGETSTILISCKDCSTQNEYHIDLETLDVPVDKKRSILKITDSIAVEMRYPTYEFLIEGNMQNADAGDMNSALDIIVSCISAVITDEERINAQDLPKEEVEEFVQSMTANQLKLLTGFLEDMPALKHEAAFKCKKCEEINELTLKGLSDFF